MTNHDQLHAAAAVGKALAVLLVLGLLARWAPTLSSLLAIIVLLSLSGYVWRALAKMPSREVAELLALAGFALCMGLLAQLGTFPLILTGLVLLVTVPLWRLARGRGEGTSDLASDEASDGDGCDLRDRHSQQGTSSPATEPTSTGSASSAASGGGSVEE